MGLQEDATLLGPDHVNKARVAEIPAEHGWLLLGIQGPKTDLGQIWLRLLARVAKRNIARAWWTMSAPTVEDWQTDLDWCQRAEQMVYTARGHPKKWEKMWGDWRNYRGKGRRRGGCS